MPRLSSNKQNNHSWNMFSSILKSRILVAPYIAMTRNNLYIFSISLNVLTFLIYGFVTGSAINGAQTAGKKAVDIANVGYDAAKARKAIEGLAAGYDPNSLEAQGIGLAGDLVNGLVDGLGGLAGQCHLY